MKKISQVLSRKPRSDSLAELARLIEWLYFVVSPLLNVAFADPPYIERVDGLIGDVAFRWELVQWKVPFRPITQEMQETAAEAACRRLELLVPPRRRLVAGLHYFHQACRLSRAGEVAGEFLGEVVLNLAKALEVLFPATGTTGSIDAARAGLQKLGVDSAVIEADLVPAIALRNNIYSGHVQLALFTREHLQLIHDFTERAEAAFRTMLDWLLSKIATGEFDVPSYAAEPIGKDALRVIEALQRNATPGIGKVDEQKT